MRLLLLFLTIFCVVLCGTSTDFFIDCEMGTDNTTCGARTSPCRTISYSLTVIQNGSKLILLSKECKDEENAQNCNLKVEGLSFSLSSEPEGNIINCNQNGFFLNMQNSGSFLIEKLVITNTSLNFHPTDENANQNFNSVLMFVNIKQVEIHNCTFYLTNQKITIQEDEVNTLSVLNFQATETINILNNNFIEEPIYKSGFQEIEFSTIVINNNRQQNQNIQIINNSFKDQIIENYKSQLSLNGYIIQIFTNYEDNDPIHLESYHTNNGNLSNNLNLEITNNSFFEIIFDRKYSIYIVDSSLNISTISVEYNNFFKENTITNFGIRVINLEILKSFENGSIFFENNFVFQNKIDNFNPNNKNNDNHKLTKLTQHQILNQNINHNHNHNHNIDSNQNQYTKIKHDPNQNIKSNQNHNINLNKNENLNKNKNKNKNINLNPNPNQILKKNTLDSQSNCGINIQNSVFLILLKEDFKTSIISIQNNNILSYKEPPILKLTACQNFIESELILENNYCRSRNTPVFWQDDVVFELNFNQYFNNNEFSIGNTTLQDFEGSNNIFEINFYSANENKVNIENNKFQNLNLFAQSMVFQIIGNLGRGNSWSFLNNQFYGLEEVDCGAITITWKEENMDFNTNLHFVNNYFNKQRAQGGCCIYLSYDSSVHLRLENNKFEDNNAIIGVVYLSFQSSTYSTIDLRNNVFKDNSVEEGTLYISGTVNLQDMYSKFIKNKGITGSHISYIGTGGIGLTSQSLIFNNTLFETSHDGLNTISFLGQKFIVKMYQTEHICFPGFSFQNSTETNYQRFYSKYLCESCPSGTYSLEIGSNINHIKCLDCPVGGNCLGHNSINALPNFWGSKYVDCKTNKNTKKISTKCQKNEQIKQIEFIKCPNGYCCDPSKEDKYKDSQYCPYDHCQGNREGVLCGKCKENYTETILEDPQCVELKKLKSQKIEFAIRTLSQAFIYIIFLMLKPESDSTFFTSISYFFQVLPYVTNQKLKNLNGGWNIGKLSFFSQIYNFQITLSSFLKTFGVCPFKNGMNGSQKILMKLWIVFLVISILILILFINKLFLFIMKSCKSSKYKRRRKKLLKKNNKNKNSNDDNSSLSSFSEMSSEDEKYPILNKFKNKNDDDTDDDRTDHDNDKDTYGINDVYFNRNKKRTVLQRFIYSLTIASLLSYTILTSSLLELVHCTPVKINNQINYHLFRVGNVQCLKNWQILIICIIIIFLVPFPFLILLWQKIAHKLNKKYHTDLFNSSLIILEGPYVKNKYFWTVLIMYRRFFIVLTFVLFTDPFTSAIVQTSLSYIFLIIELYYRPRKNRIANKIEISFLSLLTLLSMLNLRDGSIRSFGFTERITQVSSSIVINIIELCLTLLAVLFSLLIMLYIGVNYLKKRRNNF
ncbi:g protein-coupled receptor-related [Anaeramoeba flamelloides]|uniref:G protein-coupled receptor-related n=1 Tax=Anaeramoeba flamelloides TaxID=1746091 RepID=A0AAV7YHR0_9EUKA|nr:g protein-coupled receptor-related [Anaeramoeba flamelloides]